MPSQSPFWLFLGLIFLGVIISLHLIAAKWFINKIDRSLKDEQLQELEKKRRELVWYMPNPSTRGMQYLTTAGVFLGILMFPGGGFLAGLCLPTAVRTVAKRHGDTIIRAVNESDDIKHLQGGTSVMSLVTGGALTGLVSTVGLDEVGHTEEPVTGYVLPMDIQDTGVEADATPSDDYVTVRTDTSTLLAGATRSGKSEAAKLLAYQMIGSWARDEPLVAYDRKDDWQTFFSEEAVSHEVLSADPGTATVTWDLFADISDERDIDRIARGLFDADRREEEGTTDEFFETAGRQVFAAVCKYLYRTFGDNDRTPSNADLLRYVRTTPREQAYEDLSRYEDLGMAAQAIDPEAEGQAAGVWANLTQDVADLFVGTFRDPPDDIGTISLKEYFEKPENTALVISHPYKFGDTVERMYSYLIDDAIRRSMSRDGGSVLLLDELPQLPKLSNLDELVNVGAGRDVRTLITIQSVGQMNETYGEEAAMSLLAGMPTQVLLRSGDPDTTNYYRGAIGQKYEDVMTVSANPMGDQFREEERHQFDQSFLTTMDPGQAIIKRPDGWIQGQLKMLNADTRALINRLRKTE